MNNTTSDTDKVKRLTEPRLLPTPEEKAVLRPREVAWYMRWSVNTVLTLIHSGELDAIKVKSRYFIPNTALRTYLRLPAA